MAFEEEHEEADMLRFEQSLFVDESSNVRGSGYRILLKSSNGDVVEHSVRFSFQVSNNEA